MDYQPIFNALLPDLIVVISLFAALGVDYGYMRQASLKNRANRALQICSLGLIGGLVVLVLQLNGTLSLDYAELLAATHGQLMLSPGTLALKWLLFALGLAVLPLAARNMVTVQVSEYFALLLLATLGMGFMVTSRNLLGAFVALEVVSLSLYALCALHQTSRASAEAALKYLTYGGVSSAFLLFGISYLFGVTGKLDISQVVPMEEALVRAPMLVTVAYLFILVGLGFKIALAPFHLWAPDVYQSAPTPVAAWVASGSKIAGVVLLLALLSPVSMPSVNTAIIPMLAILAVVSMAVGNLGALRQVNIKRLLAYSAIANAGYLLVAILAFTEEGRAAAVYYAVVYAVATLGAFAVVAILSDRLGREAQIDDFRGCWKARPWLSLALLIFVLSLAGIPPLAGFVGKFYLFFAAIQSHSQIGYWSEGLYWLVALALGFSVVALYYYLKVLKAVFVSEETCKLEKDSIGWPSGVVILILSVITVGLGVWPGPLIEFIGQCLI
jgi:NADH-quinone oxidoreductase subunit N